MSDSWVFIAFALICVIAWIYNLTTAMRELNRPAESTVLQKVYAVWAAQGPFESALDSKTALESAIKAISGLNLNALPQFDSLLSGHEKAFEKDPSEWERTRVVALEHFTEELDQTLVLAKGLAATQTLNREFLAPIGKKIELGTADDGSLAFFGKNLTAEQTNHELSWSENPGAHETHLRVRLNNPYFPEEKQWVSQLDLRIAQQKDRSELEDCQKLSEQTLEAVEKTLSSDGPLTTGDLLELRENIVDVLDACYACGDAAKVLAAKMEELRVSVIADIKSVLASQDDKSIEILNDAEKLYLANRQLATSPEVLLFMNSTPPSELVESIVSSSPRLIRLLLSNIRANSPDLASSAQESCLATIASAQKNGYEDPLLEEKLSALSAE